MNDAGDKRFADHPAPSIGLFTIFLLGICSIIVCLPFAAADLPEGEVGSAIAVGLYLLIGLLLAVLCFYLWPLYTTYYILDKNGITVKYGPWTRVFRWDEFKTAYRQKGMFLTRIGWPSVTPCVRLSNGVVLARKHKRWGLYLTPNDPAAFIRTVEVFAPRLTEEMMK